MSRPSSTLYTGIAQLALPHPDEGTGRAPIDVIDGAALWVEDGVVRAAGPAAEVERAAPSEATRVDLEGRAVIPGLVDSHTHIVFAGDRIDEMARRARGETYEEIARAGGGIVRSVEALRGAGEDELLASARRRLDRLVARGTTTCEIKSGYGLEAELEHKQLRVIGRLRDEAPVDVVPTLLAHVIPARERHDRPAFIARFIRDVLEPAATAGAARYFDVFVETGAFSPDEARTLCARAKALGLALKLHVDQLRPGGGAELAAELGALSADHLEHTGDEGRAALARAGVVATVLPGCTLFLGKGPWPPARALRDAGCEVAVATDCNPGSAHVQDLPLCGTLAATLCGLTLEEALWGVTRGGAKALGLCDRGTLRPGERADFVVLDHADWRALFYSPAAPPVALVVAGGVARGRATRS